MEETSSVSSSEEDNNQYKKLITPIPQKSLSPVSFTNFLKLESQILYSCFFSLISLIFSFFSLSNTSNHTSVESATDYDAGTLPSGGGIGLLARKVAAGILGAAYVCFVLVIVMFVAVILGVVLVRLFVEEPVFVREKLLFDYAEVNPSAVFWFGEYGFDLKKKPEEIPVGQTYYVDLNLLLPESDYNIDVGMFQLVAEVLTTDGRVIDRSSRPCMLRFRSLPVRLVRTCLFSVPLILGMRFETQRITIPMLRHKEGYPRTEAIKMTIVPRAGTFFLPQLYEAEMIINSELPWRKELVHSWKWTFYVWTSVYMYIVLLIVLGCWFKPLIFPVMTASYSRHDDDRDITPEVPREKPLLTREAREVSERLRRLKEIRNKRKEMFLHEETPENGGSSASSIDVTRDDSTTTVEDTGDRESECFED